MRPLRTGDAWAWPGEAAACAWLRSLGLRAGERVALGGLNREATMTVLAAALRLGLVVIPLNRRLAVEELRLLHARAAPRLTLADAAHPLAAAVACVPLPATWDIAQGDGGPLTGSLVLFTSGTTATPRAVRLGAAAIRAALDAHVAALALTTDDDWSLPLPLDHVGGIMGSLRALVCGCAVTVEAAPGPDATGASLVPTMLARLVAAGTPPPRSLRTALIGGGPLDAELAAAAGRLGWPVVETYGLTEMGSMVTLDGHAVPGAQVRLLDGRVLVAGPMRCDGYETDDGLIPAAAWHETGDLGELRDDRLRILGRQAELIVSGGENVSACEVEAVLAAHPSLVEACVVGLPDAQWGELVAAAVVVRDGLDPAVLDSWLQSRLAGYKRPRRWLMVEALPRTSLGKVQRHRVRAMFG